MEYPLRRCLLPILTVGAFALTVMTSCGRGHSAMDSISANDEYLAAVAALKGEERSNPVSRPQPVRKSAKPQPTEPFMTPFEYESVNDAPWPEIFNDSNKYQYPYAEKFGIDPIHSIGQAYYTRNPLVHVKSCANYDVDALTHSVAYLVPRAEQLLSDIGADFIARLKKRGITGWRLRVTSLLRTPGSVKKLRRVNINATDSSAHQFATTFDISYLHFRDGAGATPASENVLKQTLAETLFDFRKKERCMVKYETKTHCFHITTTQ